MRAGLLKLNLEDKMDKSIYKSKTVWGFGITLLGVLGTQVGVLDPSTTLSVVQTLATGLGVYGLRDAIN